MKIYGPYLRKDGRKHLCIVHDNGRKQTKSYPRYLMEQHLGRELLPHEHIDHINNDKTDDRIENLQILTLEENAKKNALLRPRQQYSGVCPNCGVSFTKPLNIVKGNHKKGRKGPYCSRQCAGQHTHIDHWSS